MYLQWVNSLYYTLCLTKHKSKLVSLLTFNNFFRNFTFMFGHNLILLELGSLFRYEKDRKNRARE